MRSALFKVVGVTVLVMMLVTTVSAQPVPDKTTVPNLEDAVAIDQISRYSVAGPEVYIVRLEDAPLATYRGDVAGLEATSPSVTGARKLDVNSPASVAYREYLAQKQDQLLAAMENAFGHDIEVLFQYDATYNGMAVRLTGQEAIEVAAFPGVVDVQRDTERYLLTDVGPAWIGAPGIWDGSDVPGGVGSMGEGIIVGVIDTGINSDHPSFADVGGDGYDHTNPWGAGNYVGYCVANPGFCNDKLIGAWSFVTEPTTPEDSDGHGSHTSSTAAGNMVSATRTTPNGYEISADISGVAPHANIVMYDACVESCPGAALIAASNQALIDGVDVINYSISGGSDPYNDTVEQNFLALADAGVFVSTSAGNSGPGASTVAHLSPWVATVGASTHNRLFINSLINMSGGDTPAPADIEGQSITVGYGPAPIVYAPGDGQCLTPFPAGTWTNGEIVVCDRGTIARVDKGANVLAGGAGGFVLANTAEDGESIVADAHYLPAVHIKYSDAQVLEAWLASGSGHMATIAGTTVDYSPSNGDIMAGFSSRGPNTAFDVLKPDVTAPGVSIFAAYRNGIEYEFVGGTSMSSPHNAGAAALLMAVNPGWTPAEIKSALMTTGVTASVLKEDDVTPADPFDMGAGRDDLSRAAKVGLVFNETEPNYSNADPDLGGDPKTLNMPSMADSDCQGTCSWTRTAKSTLASSATWTASVSGAPPGLVVTVSPSSFEVTAGGTQAFTVTADVTGFNAALDGSNGWGFAWVILESSGEETLHLPVAVRKSYTSAPLLLTKEPSVLSAGTGDVVTYTITLSNRDIVSNTYSLTDTLPAGVEYVPGSATGGLVYDGVNHVFTWTNEVGPGAIEYTFAEVTPLPYVNLGDIGAQNLCELWGGDCDDTTVGWNLGANSYTFYGETLSQIRQNANGMFFGPEGWLGSACSACNQHMPEPTEVNQVIGGLWRDVDARYNPPVGTGEWYGGYILTGLLPNPADEVFYGNWHEVGQYDDPTIVTSHGIAVVMDGQSEPAGRIYFIYDDTTPDLTINGYAVGVEDKYGLFGTTHSFTQCSGGPCIPHPPVGSPPADGTTLRFDPVYSSGDSVKTFTYQATVTAEAPDLLTNVVEVTSDSPDPEAQDMWAIADVSVVGPILSITKAVQPVDQYPGEPVSYTIVFGNEGNADALGVVVSDVLPAEVEYASSNPPGVYDPVAHELVWGPLDLAPDDMIEATVVVTIGAEVAPSTWMTNTVYLFHANDEPLMAEASHHAQARPVEYYYVYLPIIAKNH